MRVGALVGEIAGDDPEASPSRSREVYLSVQHVDLPLLSGAGFVTYDHDSGEVSLAIPVARVGTLLDAVDERVA